MSQRACGIDIGGSGVKGGLVDLATGEVIGDVVSVVTPTPATREAVIDACRRALVAAVHIPNLAPSPRLLPSPPPLFVFGVDAAGWSRYDAWFSTPIAGIDSNRR